MAKAKKIVIVESPTKAKTIGRFLGKGYDVESSYGHVRDLPRSKLGIDVEKNFEPAYIIPMKARKLVTGLKKLVAKSSEVILATDEDREGEAIAWHLAEALKIPEGVPTKRIVFHEITKSAIEAALAHPRALDVNLVNAQQGRRILDRLVGYKLSPFLWKKVLKGLSAGRVQSVALRLIVEREEEIRKFKPEEYWTIDASLFPENRAEEKFPATLMKIGERTLEKFDIKDQSGANEIVAEAKRGTWRVIAVNSRTTKREPAAPFTTSTLQQTAARRLGFSAKKTMFLAQRLYENGLITYMRTDSVNIAKEALDRAKNYLEANFPKEYTTHTPRTFSGKSRLAQEAHEAVRPTDVSLEPEKASFEEAAERKLYTLIWQRFLASQMPPAVFDTTGVIIECAGGKEPLTFKANGTTMKFDGFLKVWKQKVSETELPVLKEGETLTLDNVAGNQHFTEPPPRFSEASLVKTLEEFGIGRPSTYAPTISTIMARNYVTKDAGRFHPTEIGETVNKVLVENFPEIVDIDFTAKMEATLDGIAEGKENWQDVIGAFYIPFAKNLEEKYESVQKTVMDEKTDIVCDKCGKPMVIKFGRFGKFLACSGFPECKNTKALPKEPPKSTGIVCPKCNQGELVERRVTRGRARGRKFYGCNRYPDCDYATWEDPTGAKKTAAPEKKEEESTDNQ